MESYGSVGNWADSVINKAVYGAIGKKIAQEEIENQTNNALSKQGISPTNSEGGSNATPQTEQGVGSQADVNKELLATQKANKSLEKKIANWKAKAEYRNSLIKLQQKELKKYQMKEMVGVK